MKTDINLVAATIFAKIVRDNDTDPQMKQKARRSYALAKQLLEAGNELNVADMSLPGVTHQLHGGEMEPFRTFE